MTHSVSVRNICLKVQSSPIDPLPIIKNSNHPLLRLRTISNINELFPFFNYLAKLYSNGNLYIRNEQSVLEDFFVIEFFFS
jgi:hypothetical protein